MADKNLATLFQNRAYRFSDRPWILHKQGATWLSLTWEETARKVEAAGRGLIVLGIEPGDRIAIFARNGPEWVVADLALLSIGAVLVPLDPGFAAAQVRYILGHSEAKAVFVSPGETELTVESLQGELPSLRHILLLAGSDSLAPSPSKLTLHGLEKMGEGVPAVRFYDVLEKVDGESVSSLIYTSGTTGNPKGAMLTHANIVSNCIAAAEVLSLCETDSCLSVLPLSRPLEHTVGFFAMLHTGARIAYGDGGAQLMSDLSKAKPTVLISIPRVLETIRSEILSTFEGKPKWVRYFFQKATGHPAGVPTRPHSRTLERIHDRAFFRRIRGQLGGCLRFIVCGGSPLDPGTARFFGALRLDVLVAYGLTEASPIVSLNLPAHHKSGTSGLPLPGVQVRIAPDGEILVRGANIMKGYYRNSEATGAAVDGDGFLRTGDVGLLDSEGYLTLMNRKSDAATTPGRG
ncbi:MAG: AMP-binding protein [Pseudomonadota bacterium]